MKTKFNRILTILAILTLGMIFALPKNAKADNVNPTITFPPYRVKTGNMAEFTITLRDVNANAGYSKPILLKNIVKPSSDSYTQKINYFDTYDKDTPILQLIEPATTYHSTIELKVSIKNMTPATKYLQLDVVDATNNPVTYLIEFIFLNNRGADIKVEHRDVESGLLISEQTVSGFEYHNAIYSPLNDPAYDLVPGQVTEFIHTNTAQTVVLNYQRKSASSLNIEHRDFDTNALIENETIDNSTLKYGDTYQVTSKTLPGYTYHSGLPSSPLILESQPLSHTLYYSKNAPVLKEFNVSFETNGGTPIAPQKVMEGSKLLMPTLPSKSGFNFVNWYSDSNFNSVYNFDTPISSDLTLYAKWSEIIPDNSNTDEIPNIPDNSDTDEIPNIPDNSDTDEIPNIPSVPSVPESPNQTISPEEVDKPTLPSEQNSNVNIVVPNNDVESKLPETGVDSSISIAPLFVILGICTLILRQNIKVSKDL